MNRNKIILLSLAFLVSLSLFAQRNRGSKTPKKTAIPEVSIDEIQQQLSQYRFSEAITALQNNIESLKRKKQPTDEQEHLLSHAVMGENMLHGTERVCIIDSFVVDKNQLLSAFKFSREVGDIIAYNDYFNSSSEATASCTLYQNQLGNKIIYSQPSAGDAGTQLFSSISTDGKWSPATAIAGLDDAVDANYPFAHSDGITLYYAAKGESSLGGYDIFVTREGNENGRYLKPENLGMPFNSPANDYLLVIDDFTQLGWFASDRYQPEGKVCVYVFIPNESRETFTFDETVSDSLRQRAMLTSISATWDNPSEVRKARQRLAMSINAIKGEQKHKDFTFVIDDLTTYYSLADFKSAEACEQMKLFLQQKKDYTALTKDLERERASFTQKSSSNARSRILILEQQCEQLSSALHLQEKTIRNIEINHLNQ